MNIRSHGFISRLDAVAWNIREDAVLKAENYNRLTRLYIPEQRFASGESCFLSDGQAHYLRNVMRKERGDQLRVFNGRDGEWLASIAEINKKNVLVEFVHKTLEQKKSSDIWVLASPVKKEAFDLMVEKSCELGAAKFIPVVCDHTVVHKVNRERLQAIAIEAAEQCERLDVMEVEPLIDLKKYLNSINYNRDIIFCIERSDAPSIANIIKKLSGKPQAVLIGPEGGFSTQELDSIGNLEYIHRVSLGERILRAETALIAALAVMQLADENTIHK